MKKILKNAFFIALILFFSIPAPGGAQEIGGKVHTVIEGETLLDIAQTDEVMVLAIKILNDLENPLELKTGSKIILPDASFITEISNLTTEDLELRAEEYRARISSTLMAELDASYIDPQLQKNMGNLAELPKPVDVNPGFFQGVMPAFKPMYGFIGSSLDTGLAALEETWNSPQNTPSSYFQTSLGTIPAVSQRVTAPVVAMSTSGNLPKSYNTSRSRSSTPGGTQTTGKSSTSSANSGIFSGYNPKLAQNTTNNKELAAAIAKAAQNINSKAGKIMPAVNKQTTADDRKYAYGPPPSTSEKKMIANSPSSNIFDYTYKPGYSPKTTTKKTTTSSSKSSSTDWGSIAGGVAGGIAGGMVGGVVGAVAGATIGSKISNSSVGKKIGEVANKLKFW